MMNRLDLIREMVKKAHEDFLGTVKDITPEMLQVDPGQKALPLGATWAHLVFSEDVIVHSMLQSKQSLFESSFLNNTGASMPMPPMDSQWSEANELWARSVKFDLPKFIAYQEAVFAATSKYVDFLHEDQLDDLKDLGTWGKMSVWFLLTEYIIGHKHASTGEISVLKGLQGVRGFPY